MKRVLSILVGFLFLASPGHAQITVHDTSVRLRNAVTAVLKEYLLEVQTAQHSQLRRMAQRLSMFTDLRIFGAPDAPRWRTHPRYEDESEGASDAFQVALDFGDRDGVGYRSVVEPLIEFQDALEQLPRKARAELESRLATIEASDSIGITTIHNAGRLRYAGRAELRAIDTLEQDVTDGSLEQSTTAVLDKISGATLIGAHQRQTRNQLLIGLVEQLVAETKRERDTHTAAVNMQLAQWKYVELLRSASGAPSAASLSTWRQP